MNKTFFIILLSIVYSVSFAQSKPTLEVGEYRLSLEVMPDEKSRMQGMMFRETMGENDGMLFVFPQTAYYCMWMKNTKIPLTVAFIDEQGTLINLADMAPETETSHCAKRPARYALEVPQGWFQQRDIAPGFKIPGVTRYPALD